MAKKAKPIPMANRMVADVTKPTAKRRSFRRKPGAIKLPTCQKITGLARISPVTMPILKRMKILSSGPGTISGRFPIT